MYCDAHDNCSALSLAVISGIAVLSIEMLVEQSARDAFGFRVRHGCAERQVSDLFENACVISSIGNGVSPCERSVRRNENGWHRLRIEALKAADDRPARVRFVFILDFAGK